MSTPVCLRSAFGACRPCKSVRVPIRTSLTQSRQYADTSAPKIKGVPRTSSPEEQKKMLDQIPEQAPPKRPSPQGIVPNTPTANAAADSSASPPAVVEEETEKRKPPKLLTGNVIAAYREPQKHEAKYGVPVASLQLRSFSLRSLEFFSDFALRAAFYLNLPASGPVSLPKRRERWTVPRSNFVHKKSMENFDRITYKRLITVFDGEKSAVEVWLAALRKWQFYGVGMKANVWEWEGLDVGSKMDAQTKELEKDLDAKLANFGWNKSVAESKSLQEMLQKQGARQVGVSMLEVREESKTRKSQI